MTVHLINPSHKSFGTAIITPRWLYVLAAATPRSFGDPLITDESLEPFDLSTVKSGDVVGIGIHTSNALRGYEVGGLARARGAHVVFGGIHATLYPEEAHERGGAHAVVRGDGDIAWAQVLADCTAGKPNRVYEAGRIAADEFVSARWDLMPRQGYMWASVQTVRGCPKHCSFCSVWRTDGQKPRQRPSDAVIDEIVQLRRLGFRFIALADDNFYPVTLDDLAQAERRGNTEKLNELKAIREERFTLMARMAQLPDDLVFYTQITMEAAEDSEFLDAMRKARIRGALVGVEAVTPEGLKDIYKGFNVAGEDLVARLQLFRQGGVHVLGSFIFGLPSDTPNTFEATASLAQRAEVTFAQFVMLTPLPGTVDFERWEKEAKSNGHSAEGVPGTRYWLLNPTEGKTKVHVPHPTMSEEEISRGTQQAWNRFYRLPAIWQRARCMKSLRHRLAFVLASKLYRQMYAETGITTDSARISRATRAARWMGKPCRRLFAAKPMPELQAPPVRLTFLEEPLQDLDG